MRVLQQWYILCKFSATNFQRDFLLRFSTRAMPFFRRSKIWPRRLSLFLSFLSEEFRWIWWSLKALLKEYISFRKGVYVSRRIIKCYVLVRFINMRLSILISYSVDRATIILFLVETFHINFFTWWRSKNLTFHIPMRVQSKISRWRIKIWNKSIFSYFFQRSSFKLNEKYDSNILKTFSS